MARTRWPPGSVNPGLLHRTGRSDRQRRWVPKRAWAPAGEIDSQDNQQASADSQAKPGPRPDPTPAPPQNQRKQGRTTTYILPAEYEGLAHSARIRLFLGLCSTSARPSASSTGGTYMPNRPRRPFLRPYQPLTGLVGDRPQASTVPCSGGLLLVGVAERHPVAALLQHGVQVLDAAQLVAKLGLADLDDQGGRLGVRRPRQASKSDLPGGVARIHGSPVVPDPAVRLVIVLLPSRWMLLVHHGSR